jgi:hypothetical protein
LKEAEDSPDIFRIVPILSDPQVLQAQDNLEEPEREGGNIVFEAAM